MAGSTFDSGVAALPFVATGAGFSQVTGVGLAVVIVSSPLLDDRSVKVVHGAMSGQIPDAHVITCNEILQILRDGSWCVRDI